MVSQLLAMIEMQWRCRINSIRRESWVGNIITLIFSISIATTAACVFAIGLAGGILLARESNSSFYLLAWNGITAFFVFAWIIYFSHDVFRSDGISLQRLMHLPVSPAQAFALNFFQTWLNLPMLYFFAASSGLILGGCVGQGPRILWQFIPVVLYAMMVTSITSLAQAKIAVWLINPRTRRLVLVLVPALVGLFSFGFAISTNTIRDRIPVPKIPSTVSTQTKTDTAIQDTAIQDAGVQDAGALDTDGMDTVADQPISQNETLEAPTSPPNESLSTASPDRWARALQKLDVAFPPMWLGGCLVDQLAPTKTAWCLMSLMLGTSILMLRSNYALTLKYYRNGFESDAVTPKLKHRLKSGTVAIGSHPAFVERKFPGLDETYSAIVSMSWLSLSRSPEIKLSILLPMMQPVIMMLLFGRRGGPEDPHWQFAAILALAALGLFLSSGFLCNLFGLDRSGFRFWVLSPIERETILHGRNIAFGLPALFLALAMGLGIALFWKVSLMVAIESLFGLLAFFPLYLLVTNIMSILAPFPLPPGGMHPKEFSWKTLAMNLALTSCLPIIMLWCCVPVGMEILVQWFWPKVPDGPVALLGLVIVFWRSWTFYHHNLPVVGSLLQAREVDLLKTVTMHVEKK